MRRFILICATILLSGLVFYSCKPNDQKMLKELETAISSVYQNIGTTVKDGVATIQGEVESEEAKAAIEKLTSSIKGVKSVVNNITVKSKNEAPVVINTDTVLNTAIKEGLSLAGFKDVTIEVIDGEITLGGSAKRADLGKIMQIANESKPKRVINKINLK